MNENLAFIYGICCGFAAGVVIACLAGVVAIWRSSVRDGEQAGENCE